MKLLLYILLVFFFSLSDAQKKDSVNIRTPRHYFNTIILWDYYQKPQVNLNGNDYVSQKIKSYQIQQSTLAFNIPLSTTDFYHPKDSLYSNLSILFTGYFLRYNPNFAGLDTRHILEKNGLGIRVIYNNGRRSIFFADFSPFVTKDKNFNDTRIFRLASLLLWNYTINEYFNFRLGLTKSFMWGNRYYLPFVGLRIGKINKINFSIQFPRYISLNIPLTNYFQISWFTKPQGGLFSMQNNDTLYPIMLQKNKVIYLGRYEFLSGVRIDIKPLKRLSVYFSAGRTIDNYLAMYSVQFNKNRTFRFGHFFENRPGKSLFINFGIVVYLGQTKSYFYRKNIDQQIYLNNEIGVGDQNIQVYQNSPNVSPQKGKIQSSEQELSDLINTFDY